jgi:hypothetical protein
MLQDTNLRSAVSKIVQRSERQEDLDRLVGLYVDVGLLPQLENVNHQVLYGRRGTGKTHVLKVLESHLRSDQRNAVVYIDCRTLGSTSQFSDADSPMRIRCLALFRDVLLSIHHDLLEHIIEHPPQHANKALEAVDYLQSIITERVQDVQLKSMKEERSASSTDSGKAGANIGAQGVSAGGQSSSETSSSAKRESEFSVTSSDKIVFPDLRRALEGALRWAECRIYVLIDEWSSLPRDVQPYLAEFLKRGLIPMSTATLKVGALEHRSHFRIDLEGSIVGFELGADIATAPDLDDYFVYDRNPESITDTYADVLFRHLSNELPEGYLRTVHRVQNGAQLASRLFTERATCAELARAAEGVIRDLINIFTQAFFHADRRARDSIDRQAVLESARQWFEQDKAQYLDNHLQAVLRKIVDEVIGRRRARSFLLPRALEKHPTIQRLFDSRVLHLMRRGYADKANPGLRYNIYTIDYGAYVDLINTSKQPQLDLAIAAGDDEDAVVPFDDRRSIRRIVLSETIL